MVQAGGFFNSICWSPQMCLLASSAGNMVEVMSHMFFCP